jgi:hypothetical protein
VSARHGFIASNSTLKQDLLHREKKQVQMFHFCQLEMRSSEEGLPLIKLLIWNLNKSKKAKISQIC